MISKKSALELIKEVIKAEADALMSLTDLTFECLYEVAEHICSKKNKVILTGVGKSAIVARKLTATLNSTGTPSIYLHAGDAIHGDLGIVQADDTVIVISKSGNSDELNQLVPQLKNRGASVIGFVSNDKSMLARSADILVHIPVASEAGPHGLAPTSSIVAHIAVGDALAMLLQQRTGWSTESFAAVHPGGTLGKRLSLKINDLKNVLVRPVILPDASIKETIVEISSKRMGAVAVLSDEKLCGIITDGDLRRMLETNDDLHTLKAKDIMTSNPKCINSGMLAYDVLKQMEQYNISQVLVVDDSKYLGIIHLHDLIKEGL